MCARAALVPDIVHNPDHLCPLHSPHLKPSRNKTVAVVPPESSCEIQVETQGCEMLYLDFSQNQNSQVCSHSKRCYRNVFQDAGRCS